MIENRAPEKLLLINVVSSYSKIFIQHTFTQDSDPLGKQFYVYNNTTLVKDWVVTDPQLVSTQTATIPGLTSNVNYKVSGQYYDKMIDTELLQARFGINVSNEYQIKTQEPPRLTNVVVSQTQVEVGVSNPTVGFSIAGEAQFVEIQYKVVGTSEWGTIYQGDMQSPKIILPPGKYNFRVRGKITLPDGATTESSQYQEYGSIVDVQYQYVPPQKPTKVTYKVQKIIDGIVRYDVKVLWDWVRGQGQQIKQFIVEYTPVATFNQSGWAGSQKVNTSTSTTQILVNFPYNQQFKLRVTATSWGPDNQETSTQSDVIDLIIDINTVISDNFTQDTGVEVGYYGIQAYRKVGQQKVQTFNLDAATGNLSIGIQNASGKVPFSFDQTNNILNVSGRTITDIINAASFVLTNTSGTPPSLYSQEKPNYESNNQGIWMGYVGAYFKFNMGDSQNYLKWDGTKLRISGSTQIGTPTGDLSLDEAIKGKVIVPVYKTAQTQPQRPTSTQYPPVGWTTSPDQYNPNTEKVWVSSQRIDPITNTTLPEFPWTTPVQFSGGNGQNGQTGQRGPGFYVQSIANFVSFDVTQANNYFVSIFGSGPVKYDVLTQFNSSVPSIQDTRMWNGTQWTTPAVAVHGDMIVDGSVRAEQMIADAAFFQKAGINQIYDRNAQLSANPEGTYKMKIDLASGYIHIR